MYNEKTPSEKGEFVNALIFSKLQQEFLAFLLSSSEF